MATDDGGPAYPLQEKSARANAGMSFRDAAALGALQGMISSTPVADRTLVDKAAWAVVAYDFADAMVSEKRKRDNGQV